MSNYIYCNNCERPQKAPWEMTTEDILLFIVLDHAKCEICGCLIDNYDKTDFISELADRIDKNDTA